MPTRWASSFFNRHLLPLALINMGLLRTRDLFRGASNRALFSTLSRRSNLITGTGHGLANVYAGQHKQVLWKTSEYDPSEVEGKIIKLLSCESGSEEGLGGDLIAKGAEAFQGYNKTFAFFVDSKHVLIPWLDPIAAKFLRPVMMGVRALLEGKTNKEAYQIEYDLHTKNIEAETDPEIKDWQIHNRDSLVMLGNPDAKITKNGRLLRSSFARL